MVPGHSTIQEWNCLRQCCYNLPQDFMVPLTGIRDNDSHLDKSQKFQDVVMTRQLMCKIRRWRSSPQYWPTWSFIHCSKTKTRSNRPRFKTHTPYQPTRSLESVPRRQTLQEWRHACGRPSTTWIHQICHNTGVTATEALQLAEDRPFWRTIATAGGSSWMLSFMIISTALALVRQLNFVLSH